VKQLKPVTAQNDSAYPSCLDGIKLEVHLEMRTLAEVIPAFLVVAAYARLLFGNRPGSRKKRTSMLPSLLLDILRGILVELLFAGR
jgi:hypothetical protein